MNIKVIAVERRNLVQVMRAKRRNPVQVIVSKASQSSSSHCERSVAIQSSLPRNDFLVGSTYET